jgi:hypothetical protein
MNERWKGPWLFTYFRPDHVILRWRRFDFLFHWPSRTFNLIIWRWDQPRGEIFLRSFGFGVARVWDGVAEAYRGIRLWSFYLHTYCHKASAR